MGDPGRGLGEDRGGKLRHRWRRCRVPRYRRRRGKHPAVTTVAIGTTNGNKIDSCSAGEWLSYTVTVPATGVYTFTVSASSTTTGKTLHLEDELGNNLTGTMTIARTGSLTKFASNSKTINLTAGTHVLKLVENTGGYNLDLLSPCRIERSAPGRSPQVWGPILLVPKRCFADRE